MQTYAITQMPTTTLKLVTIMLYKKKDIIGNRMYNYLKIKNAL